jgi:DNA-binding CsgD family transcriptional regulator
MTARSAVSAGTCHGRLRHSSPPAGAKALQHFGLTPREVEVLSWIARGKTNYEIAVIVGAHTRTICKHVEHILAKLRVENRTAAAATAIVLCRELIETL